MKFLIKISFVIITSVACLLSFNVNVYAISNRVLIVTSVEDPNVNSINIGSNVITDIICSGFPFDVISYRDLMKINFQKDQNYGLVILAGYVDLVDPVKLVETCKEILNENRKIFINGIRLKKTEKNTSIEEILEKILNVDVRKLWFYGSVKIPIDIEKDNKITQEMPLVYRGRHFIIDKMSVKKITVNDKIVGFLSRNIGVIDGSKEFLLNILDYGKVVGYMMYGNSPKVGFSLDRIESRPIVSFEVHCDSTNDLEAIKNIDELSKKYEIPLINLLVTSKLDNESIKLWKRITESNKFLLIGSHSHTHPDDWKKVVDFKKETIDSLSIIKNHFPAATNYFNFSGWMNPTFEQLNILESENIIFGGKGENIRWIKLPFNLGWREVKNQNIIKKYAWKVLKRITKPEQIQTMPINKTWIDLVITGGKKKIYPSQTLIDDYDEFRNNKSFFEETKRQFKENITYGIYSYAYIHDYMFNKRNKQFETNGEHFFDQIDKTFAFLKDKGAKFIFTNDLIRLLHDYLNGSIQYKIIDKHNMLVEIERKFATANFVKVWVGKNNRVGIEGDSIVKKYNINDYIYLDLLPEKSSKIKLHF